MEKYVEAELKYGRINNGGKVMGGMKKVFSCRAMGMNVKRKLYEGVVVLTALYGAEIWSKAVAEKKKLNVTEMRCLRSICGVMYMDQVRNGEVQQRKILNTLFHHT